MDRDALKALGPSVDEDAADGYRATSEMAGKAGEALDSRISAGIRNQLSGETAKAALRELKELSKDFHYAAAECALAGAALDGFAFDMAAAKRKLEAALEDAETRRVLLDQGGRIVGSNPEEFATFIRAAYTSWGEVVRATGMRLE